MSKLIYRLLFFIKKSLGKIIKLITIKDHVYSADLLKYEISPILGKWKDMPNL